MQLNKEINIVYQIKNHKLTPFFKFMLLMSFTVFSINIGTL